MPTVIIALNACGWSVIYGGRQDSFLSTRTPTPTQPVIRLELSSTPTAPPRMRVLEFKEVDGYIPNPNMGWQDSRLEMEILPETVGYDRFNWADLNPSRGEFDWSPIETLRNFKTSSGKLISFRVRTSRPAPFGPGPVVPEWVNTLGAQTFFDSGAGPEPLYHDCIFLETHAEFIEELRKRYDGDEDIAFIDIGSYGSYGEWDSDQYNEQSASLDWHARRRIADMYIGGSGVRPCLAPDGATRIVEYSYPGFQSTQLIMPFTPWFEDSLIYVTARRDDVGIRQDSLGSESHQEYILERSAQLIESRWPYAPIVFEFAPQSYTAEGLERSREFATRMHASYIHDNLDGRGDLEQVTAVLAKVGYRLVLRRVSFVEGIQAGGELPLFLEWINRGIAPPYLQGDLAIILVDGDGRQVCDHKIAVNLRSWLPDQPIELVENFPMPTELAPGFYTLKIAIVDTEGRPFIQLAIDGRDEAGYYPIGTVQVVY